MDERFDSLARDFAEKQRRFMEISNGFDERVRVLMARDPDINAGALQAVWDEYHAANSAMDKAAEALHRYARGMLPVDHRLHLSKDEDTRPEQ